jgi:hypothetical protein
MILVLTGKLNAIKDDEEEIGPNQTDFEYIIVHEIMHGLGFARLAVTACALQLSIN